MLLALDRIFAEEQASVTYGLLFILFVYLFKRGGWAVLIIG